MEKNLISVLTVCTPNKFAYAPYMLLKCAPTFKRPFLIFWVVAGIKAISLNQFFKPSVESA